MRRQDEVAGKPIYRHSSVARPIAGVQESRTATLILGYHLCCCWGFIREQQRRFQRERKATLLEVVVGIREYLCNRVEEWLLAHFVIIVRDQVSHALIPVNRLGLMITCFRADQAFKVSR